MDIRYRPLLEKNTNCLIEVEANYIELMKIKEDHARTSWNNSFSVCPHQFIKCSSKYGAHQQL